MMSIPRVFNSSFTVHADAFAIGEYGSLYFISLFGAVSAVQSVASSLLSGHSISLEDEDTHSYIYLPKGKRFHSMVRKLPSKGQHLILYPEIARLTDTQSVFLFVLNHSHSPDVTFFEYLNRRTTIPLHRSWSTWLWNKFLEEENTERLICYGIEAYLCHFQEENLVKTISEAVKTKELEVKT